MDIIFNLLEKIKSNPALYIGEKSLQKLSTFLSGYECAIYDITGTRSSFNSEFQLFVQNKKDLLFSTKHWAELISSNVSIDEAFDIFYNYLNEFRILKDSDKL